MVSLLSAPSLKCPAARVLNRPPANGLLSDDNTCRETLRCGRSTRTRRERLEEKKEEGRSGRMREVESTAVECVE